jgi:cell division protein FtsI/penicillin-binding protein 2
VLTLDPALQRDVETLLRGARAPESAAVVLDARTGRVLAWASVDAAGRDLVSEPFAPPASLFKVVTAAALLERSKAQPSTHQCYVGGERSVSLSYLRTSGAGGARCSTFSSALGYSRNMVMAGLAVRFLEADDVLSTGHKLGINGHVPINVVVGSGSCKVPTSKEGLGRAAAGFGRGRLTALEAAYMMAVIANDGERPKIELVDHLLAADGRRQRGPAPSGRTGRALRSSTAATLTQMLEVTVREGTAAHAFRNASGRRYLGHLGGAGKTGTLARGKPHRLFSWYAGFAPSRNPQVVVAVLLANDHRWWRKSNEVARDVLRAYFSRKSVAGVTHPTLRRTARK